MLKLLVPESYQIGLGVAIGGEFRSLNCSEGSCVADDKWTLRLVKALRKDRKILETFSLRFRRMTYFFLLIFGVDVVDVGWEAEQTLFQDGIRSLSVWI